jgi:ABC-type glutathione transport system ATPase component
VSRRRGPRPTRANADLDDRRPGQLAGQGRPGSGGHGRVAGNGASIEVSGLRKEFRTRRGRVPAVAGIDFRVEPGEFVAYAGPNGAGQSTTVKMMSGVLVPSAGSVLVATEIYPQRCCGEAGPHPVS